MRIRDCAVLACLLFAGSALAVPPPVPASPPVEPSVPSRDVDRLTDAVVAMLPIGKLFDEQAAADPTWPLQEAKGITPQQLACARSELSTEGYRRTKRAEVGQYAKDHPSHLRADIDVLEGGAAFVFSKLMQAGVDKAKAQSDAPIDPAAVLAGVTNEQVLAFVTFGNDPQYADLRRLTGLGDALSAGQSEGESESRGKQVGATIASRLMIQAMGTCNVPPAAYLQ
jgi:hypothetical protein